MFPSYRELSSQTTTIAECQWLFNCYLLFGGIELPTQATEDSKNEQKKLIQVRLQDFYHGRSCGKSLFFHPDFLRKSQRNRGMINTIRNMQKKRGRCISQGNCCKWWGILRWRRSSRKVVSFPAMCFQRIERELRSGHRSLL